MPLFAPFARIFSPESDKILHKNRWISKTLIVKISVFVFLPPSCNKNFRFPLVFLFRFCYNVVHPKFFQRRTFVYELCR